MSTPAKHHLDRHAASIAARSDGNPDDLLTTEQVAVWLGVSTQCLEIGRHRGYGPKFIRLSTRRTRYSRALVLEWLRQRTHQATAEYNDKVA